MVGHSLLFGKYRPSRARLVAVTSLGRQRKGYRVSRTVVTSCPLENRVIDSTLGKRVGLRILDLASNDARRDTNTPW